MAAEVAGAAGLEVAARTIADAVEKAEGRLPPKKRRVVEAAVLCFAEAGFAATSTRAIAARAGVAEATIFRHYPTKRDLLLRLVGPVAERLIVPAVEDELRGLFADDAELPAVFGRIMRNRLAVADAHAPLVRILIQELPVDPELRALLGRHIGGAMERIAHARIGAEIAAGRMRAVDPARFLRAAFSMLAGYWLARSFVPGAWDDQAEIDALVALLWRGVEPHP